MTNNPSTPAEKLQVHSKFLISKQIGLVLGPVLFALLLILPPPGGMSHEAWKTIAVALFMLSWWITEAMPLPVTALLPLVLIPMLGLAKMADAAAPYANPVVFLFMGGFMIALAMEKWSLHRRIALHIVRITGTNANGIIFGFFLSTALISMWISNTATTIMMLPIALSVIALLGQQHHVMDRGMRHFALSIMLGISYASSIGGVATLIGTPPNVVFIGFLRETFKQDISFGNWMLIGLPYSLLLLFGAYFIIVHLLYPNRLGKIEGASEQIQEELEKLGPLSPPERLTLIIFVVAAICWIFQVPLEKWMPFLHLTETGTAMMAGVALFVVPLSFRKWKFVLEWKDTEKLPWGILLLFGGGLSLADTMSSTGIIDMIGNRFAGSAAAGWLFLTALVTVTVLLTELLSNVALVTVFLPVVGAVAQGMGINPIVLCIPVTLAASSGFMLPMSTPPNAIVFASGHVSVVQMARSGVLINLLSIILMVLFAKLVLPLILGG